ncbi:MAG: hypothetical protein CUN55_10170 [Phototrophicales bacterium]|nr:MAG: hypothetical protein CUN55_10170 [Phototrophicales bacterium]
MIGQTLSGRYRIEAFIGEGATAIVYRAVDLRLQRPVAVKILLPHVSETTRKRFEREAHAAARLNHPNIMAIYDFAEDNGTEYLVVELIEGRPLYEFIPADPELVIEVGYQICVALEYAHQIGLIHRDIKPANINLTADNQIKLMDFGLAIPKQGDQKRLTASGTIIGTPAYLSPEQAQGLPLDPRTDIYSLGIVLYEMVTGLLPFDADDVGTILLQQVKKPPEPPSKHTPNMPKALEEVILKALQKKPSQRFQSAKEMGDALYDIKRGFTSSSSESIHSARQTESEEAKELRLVLADDHVLTRQSLAYFLDDLEGITVVGQASNGDEAFELVGELHPNVLLLDLNMPGTNGLVILPKIRKAYPDVKVLVLTGREENSLIMNALRAGAHGYILKTSSENELEQAVRDVASGRLVLGQGVAESLVGGMVNPVSQSNEVLDAIQKDILTLVAAGLSDSDIAHHIGMPEADMQATLMQAIDALGVSSRTDAALVALRSGLISIDDVQRL